MIVYQATKSVFQTHVQEGIIDKMILDAFHKKLGRSTGQKEQNAWWNSLTFMSIVIADNGIPEDAGIIIECQIPQTSKRIDFIISGVDEQKRSHVVIVELKQWSSAELTEKDGIVKTVLGRGLHETNHPSYQAWSYAAMLDGFRDVVNEEPIHLKPCAYLHNYEHDEVIRHPFYQPYLDHAPVFLKRDTLQLRDFIKLFIREGDRGEAMFRIQDGKLKPSKSLAESLSSIMKGNQEFILLDEQKLVYETALALSDKAQRHGKQVLIVNGGPGTGKSVVAINLLVEITRRKRLVQYVTKNQAPREVYKEKLFGTITKIKYDALFRGSGGFYNVPFDAFDALVVDEAHRLNEKSGLYSNQGENQVKEIIEASRCSIFFLDEDQRVTLKDIGTKEEIQKWAKRLKADVTEMELISQFRCNGSDGYLALLDNMLQIRETANKDLTGIDFEFRVMDSPAALRDLIFEKNRINNKARLVAGYCWDWKSKNNKKVTDIDFPEYDFRMKWNLSEESYLWIQKPNSVNEVGCIHTCQGLEVDYIWCDFRSRPNCTEWRSAGGSLETFKDGFNCQGLQKAHGKKSGRSPYPYPVDHQEYVPDVDDKRNEGVLCLVCG